MTPRDAEERSVASFLRGLTIGALVGAIIAGSTLWSRWRRSGRSSSGQASRRDDAPKDGERGT